MISISMRLPSSRQALLALIWQRLLKKQLPSPSLASFSSWMGLLLLLLLNRHCLLMAYFLHRQGEQLGPYRCSSCKSLQLSSIRHSQVVQHSSNKHIAHARLLESASWCRAMHGNQHPDIQQQQQPQHQQQQQPCVCQSEALTAAQLAPCAITQQDFQAAVKKVQPSVRREGFATTPDVTWGDVGSLAEVCTPPTCSCCCPCICIVCLPAVVYLCLSVCACMHVLSLGNLHSFGLPPCIQLKLPCCSLTCSTKACPNACAHW